MRRRSTGLAALVAATVVMTGCGNDSAADYTGANTTDFPTVTVTHALGETVVDSEPQRIVALGAAATDAVLELGGNLVGAAASPVSPTGISPWQDGSLDPEAVTLLRMDQVGGYDLEQILALDPDLVLAQEAANAAAIHDGLSGVVPVVPFREQAFGDSWQSVTRDVAAVLGREEAGEELVAAVESEADAPDELDGRTWVFLAAPTPGAVNVINNPDDPMARFFDRYGMRIAPGILALPDNAQNPGTASVSEENYGLLAADLVIVAAVSEETGREFLESPTFATLPAVQDDRVWVTDMTTAMALRSPTVLTVPWVADRLQPRLDDLATG